MEPITKPWFLRQEFWLAIITALTIFLAENFGLELDVETVLGVLIPIITYIYYKFKEESLLMEYKAEMNMIQFELRLKGKTNS